jgi:predicted phage terminase large subunit-like protein
MPVGFGKSLIVELFITWCFARNKQSMFCYISHSSDLISKLSRETKEIVESPEWIMLFGHTIKKDEKSKTQYSFDGAGSRTGLTASSMGGAVTGVDAGNPTIMGFAGALIIDDPMDISNANSKVEKEEVIRIYTDKLKTRLRTNSTPIIVIMQRIALDDLSAYILSEEIDSYEVVTIKALNEEGKSNWEERISTAQLLDISQKTPNLFNSQYQQNPISENGNFFKRDMFEECEMPRKFDYTYITADTAYKDKQENDYTVFTVFGVLNKDLFLIDILRGKIKSVDIETQCIPFIKKHSIYGFRGAFIEPKGHGIYLNQKLPNENIVMPREEVIEEFFKDRRQDKQQRANASMPFFTAHKLYINKNIDEQVKSDVITECMNFPDGLHDDAVDTIVDGIKYYMENEMLQKPFNPKW